MAPNHSPRSGPGVSPRSLRSLAAAAGISAEAPDVLVNGVVADTRTIAGGEVFVAVPGTLRDGHEFIEAAIEKGVAAIVGERETECGPVPFLRVSNSREALACLAAAWFDHPAKAVPLVGISGTLGKTSVLTTLEAILKEAEIRAGSIGSLGVRLDGSVLSETGHTAPDPVQLQGGLARLRDAGAEVVVMEVTSHALEQRRVHGLSYGIAAFTNLVPLEHADYHGSFASYVESKTRFFDHLAPDAPIIYNADDPVVSSIVAERGLSGVGVGTAGSVPVRISSVVATAQGTSFRLSITERLPAYRGRQTGIGHLDIRLRLLGISNVSNAALAATAGLMLGAPPKAVNAALAAIPSPQRRLEIIHDGEFRILDDTVGHPDSISALFGVVEDLAPTRIHIAYAIRGMRGARINEQIATSLATWAKRISPVTFAVTSSEDAADERNRVSEEERAACLDTLEEVGVPYEEHDRLADAVRAVLDAAGPGDLVLLLGAQGMDTGGNLALQWLSSRRD